MTGNDAAADPCIGRVGPPARVARRLVEPAVRPLGVPDVEIEDGDAGLARRLLDGANEATAEAVAARPRRDEGAGGLGAEGLRLVVAGRADELRRAGDHAVEPGDEEGAAGHQQEAAPVFLQRLALRPLDPAETAAFVDSRFGGVAEILKIARREAFELLDRDAHRQVRAVSAAAAAAGAPTRAPTGAPTGAHGRQRRKLPIIARPAAWLFSGWNWAPTRLSRATKAVRSPP